MTTSALRRQVKNIVHNYSEAEIKVREATSNDPWGPSSSLMSEIADLTFNVVAFAEVMGMVWRRLSDSGKNWRHVYKALTLVDYLLKTGSERVAQQCRENAFTIQALRDFQHVDRDGRDQGANVREKARLLVCLLRDEERLRQERSQALKTKERMAGGVAGAGGGAPPAYPGRRTSQPSMAVLYGEEFSRSRGSPCSFNSSCSSPPPASDLEQARPQTSGEEELQVQLALAMSRQESHKEQHCRHGDDESRTGRRTEESAMLELVDIFGPPSAEAPPSSSETWKSAPPPGERSDPWDSVAAHTSSPWVPSSDSPPGAWDAPPTSSSPANHCWETPCCHGVPDTGTDAVDRWQQANGRGAASPETLELARLAPPMAAPQTRTCRTPEAFLGATGASLVNLDALIPPNPPGRTHNNPFLSGLSAPSPSNPFHSEPPRLTLNQMRPSSTSPLPPHMIPYSPSLPLPLQRQPHASLPRPPRPDTHTHNPFL